MPRFYSNIDPNSETKFFAFGSREKEEFYMETSVPLDDKEFLKILKKDANSGGIFFKKHSAGPNL